uniref:Putative ubiquitin regulatory protein n=1 Tax=Ornithodoros turicata TaxID=34597 RepID=A0A2R5LJN1_9ACAR
MSAELNILKEMGFSEERAKKALQQCGNNSVESAMEWLLAHADDPMDTSEPVSDPTPTQVPAARGDSKDDVAVKQEPPSSPMSGVPCSSKETSENANLDGDQVPQLPKSIKCDDCGRKLRTEAEVEFHAVKTGHQSFSESTEEVKPLTEEEKLEKKKKLEEVIRQRRIEREEKAKKEAIEKEKSRRKVGQEIAHTRQKIEEQEMKKLAEERLREKMEDKLAKQRVLEQIERDKQARRQKFNMDPLPQPVQPAPVQELVAPPKDYSECKLQIRLTNGETLTQTFGAQEQLAAVRLYVQLHRTDGDAPFTLMTSFPRKVFKEEDYEVPLAGLGLVPAAVLIVTKVQ